MYLFFVHSPHLHPTTAIVHALLALTLLPPRRLPFIVTPSPSIRMHLMLSLPTTLGGGGSSSQHQHYGACPLSLLYHHKCACLSPLLHQINADLIRHAQSPTMTEVTTVLPVHATNPHSNNGKGPRCMHLTLSPTPRMCIPSYPPFTYGGSCLSSDSTYPTTQSSPSPGACPSSSLYLTITNDVRALTYSPSSCMRIIFNPPVP